MISRIDINVFGAKSNDVSLASANEMTFFIPTFLFKLALELHNATRFCDNMYKRHTKKSVNLYCVYIYSVSAY